MATIETNFNAIENNKFTTAFLNYVEDELKRQILEDGDDDFSAEIEYYEGDVMIYVDFRGNIRYERNYGSYYDEPYSGIAELSIGFDEITIYIDDERREDLEKTFDGDKIADNIYENLIGEILY